MKKAIFILLECCVSIMLIVGVISYPLSLLREYLVNPEITAGKEIMTILIIAASILVVSFCTKTNYECVKSIIDDKEEE